MSEMKRLRAAVAALALEDPVYQPVFERLERMIAAQDTISHARKIVQRQREMAAII